MYKRQLLGAKRVGYDCPRCASRLRSPLADAGKKDSCPDCNTFFIVPGKNALDADRQEKADLLKRQELHEQEARRNEEKAQRELEIERKRAEAEKAEREVNRQVELAAADLNDAREDTDESAPTSPNAKPKRLGFLAVCIIGFVVCSVLYSVASRSGAGLSDVVRSAGLRTKLSECASFKIIEADVYYSGIAAPDIVFDVLDGGESSARRIDPVHLLMQFVDKIDLSNGHTIVLARNGTPKFLIRAKDVERHSNSYANGGRLWAMDHLPPICRTPTGERPYTEWSGGFLGVMKGQAEDLNDFLTEWLE